MKLSCQPRGLRGNRRIISAAGAFTLIEMMIVLGIIGIIMTIGLPAFVTNAKKTPMRHSVNAVLDACRNAREAAIYSREPTEVVFRSEDFTLTVQKAPAAPTDPANGVSSAADIALPPAPVVAFRPIPGFSARLAEEVAVKMIGVNLQDAMDAAEAHIRFYPNGTCDEFAMVLLSSTTGEEQLITLDVITGRAESKALKDPNVAIKTAGPNRVVK